MAGDSDFDRNSRGTEFSLAFKYINEALGDAAFKKWNGSIFSGKFLMSVFEVISKGVLDNLPALQQMNDANRNEFIANAAKALWLNDIFKQNSGAGVRGTTRLAKLLPLASKLLKP